MKVKEESKKVREERPISMVKVHPFVKSRRG